MNYGYVSVFLMFKPFHSFLPSMLFKLILSGDCFIQACLGGPKIYERAGLMM